MTINDRLQQYAADRGLPFHGDEHELSAWARGVLADFRTRAEDRRLLPCPHWFSLIAAHQEQPITDPPMAGWAAWTPQVICCADCWSGVLEDGLRGGACDRCSTVLAGTAHLGLVAADDSALVAWRSCGPCMALEDPGVA